MDEEIKMYLDEARENMDNAIDYVNKAFTKIRAGRANPIMLEGILVEYYGNPTPLQQTAGITAPDARTLMVKPWEKSLLGEIERAIINANLGLNPQNDGAVIRINIPPLSEERRREFVKKAKEETENAKIGIRKARQEANDGLKELQKQGTSEDEVKRAEEKVQELTDHYTQKVEAILEEKEAEIMKV